MIHEASLDDKIIAITAAMPSGTGLDAFQNKFPDRYIDVGIAEQHAVTFAAGLAIDKFKPFCAIYSTFLQRAYDQIIHDVGIQKLPVRFAIDRAGLVGEDGATHAGTFDIMYLSSIPNFVVMAPSDELELAKMVKTAVDYNDGPIAFRYPRGSGIGIEFPTKIDKIPIGKGRIVVKGNEVLIISFGSILKECMAAVESLNTLNIQPTVIDARFSKPLDVDLLKNNINGCGVSMPFKEKIIPHIDELTQEAEDTNSVNTVYLSNNRVIGHNTDIAGFYLSLKDLTEAFVGEK